MNRNSSDSQRSRHDSILSEALSLVTTEPLTFVEFVSLANPKYQWTPALLQLAMTLQLVADDRIHRFMCFMPPRHGKSELISRLFSAYYLLRHPDRWVGINSYGADLAHTLAFAARDNFIKAGGQLDNRSRAVDNMRTAAGGGMWAAGVGGPITGKGFHLGIIDDPLKNMEEADSETIREKHKEWYRSTFYTREEPGGAIIVIQTRWHEDDLSGYLLKAEQEAQDSSEAERWIILNFPAIRGADAPFPASCRTMRDRRNIGEPLNPLRYPLERLVAIKGKVGDRVWNALYQQNPMVEGGNIFRYDWWDGRNRYKADDGKVRRTALARWIFMDTALKDKDSNDYTAWAVLELTPSYHIVVREIGQEKVLGAFVPNKVEDLANRYNVDGKLQAVAIEDKGSGTTAIQTLRATAPAWLATIVQEFTPAGTKEYRARQASVWCARDCVLLPEPSDEVPWLFGFSDPTYGQLFQFPHAQHDDMVDAFTMGLIFLEHYAATGWQARQV